MPIFDQGYQHWNGPLSGHGGRWLAVARHGIKNQLGNRFVRLFMILAWLPALALVGFVTLWGLLEQQAESVVGILSRVLPPEIVADPKQFRGAVWTIAYSYFLKAELVFALFLVLMVGPNLVSRDLRFNALPLYLSRPVRRIDYFVGKLAVIGFFLGAIIVLPALGAYLLGLAFSLNLSVVGDTWRVLVAGVLFGLLVAVSAGTLILALSSLSRRSIYVGLAWAGFILLTWMLGGILSGIRGGTERQEAYRASMAEWQAQNPAPPGVAAGPGPYSTPRNTQPNADPNDPKAVAELRARERYIKGWEKARDEAFLVSDAAGRAGMTSDWRPLVSYPVNLDRLGESLLGTDAAWVQIGAATERMGAGGPRSPARPGQPAAPPAQADPDAGRRTADRRVWQFPWYWSAGVLAGVWAVSAFVLSRRVKSLDRLK